MLIVKVRNKKQIDKALKELKNKVYDTKQLKEIHNRKEYKKKSQKKREQKKKAIYVNKKFKND